MSAPVLIDENGGRRFGGVPDAGGGRGKKIFDRQVGGGEFSDDAAAVEHQRAVAHLGDLLEISRHDHDSSAGLESHVE